MRIAGMLSIMHLPLQSYMCCTLQEYARLFDVALASIRTDYYSGVHNLFVEGGSVRRYALTCLPTRICSLRLRL